MKTTAGSDGDLAIYVTFRKDKKDGAPATRMQRGKKLFKIPQCVLQGPHPAD
tara:strand:- start:218 stop:373 length:156 start_codon:yes stop_codon:yes gene_type:complete